MLIDDSKYTEDRETRRGGEREYRQTCRRKQSIPNRKRGIINPVNEFDRCKNAGAESATEHQEKTLESMMQGE